MNIHRVAERVRLLRQAVEVSGAEWKPGEWVINICAEDYYDLVQDQNLVRDTATLGVHGDFVYGVDVVVDSRCSPGEIGLRRR